MKKILALVVAFGIAATVVGCGGSTTPTSKPATSPSKM
jgi:hypothetical protein